MIGIRVDVNQKVATGHIKRDIAITLCLREIEFIMHWRMD